MLLYGIGSSCFQTNNKQIVCLVRMQHIDLPSCGEQSIRFCVLKMLFRLYLSFLSFGTMQKVVSVSTQNILFLNPLHI